MPHHPRRSRPILLAASLALLALPVAAQPVDEVPPLVEEISVEVVNVDVIVVDDRGRPVTGLSPEDFVVFEDGKRREITNFFSFRNGELQVAGGESSVASEDHWPDQRMRRRMIFLFDNNSLEKRDRRAAIEQLERFVLEQFDGTYEWAVIAYDDELQMMEPFTSDKTTVLGALGKVRELPIPVRRRRASDITMEEQLPVVSRQDFRRGRRGIDQVTQDLTLRDFDLRERMVQGVQIFDRTTRAITQTMRAYMGMDGRKSLVLVTGSLQSLPGGQQLLGRGLPGSGGDDRVDQMVTVMHSELLRRYEAIIKMANAAGFSIYPISADALMKAHSSALDVERSSNLAFSSSFGDTPTEIDVETASRTMADNTGGRFYSTTHFYDAFDDIDDRTANSYVLGFPTDHRPEGDYHRVRVETTKPGLSVLHRRGYLHLSREQQIAEELSTPLAFPKDRGDFGVEMEIFPPDEDDRRRKKVDLTVAGRVPVSSVTLIPQGDRMVGRIHLYVAIYDLEGNLVSLVRDLQDVNVAAAKVRAAADDAPARFGLTLKDLPRGQYTITVTVIDDITNRYGTGLEAVAL